MCKSFIKLTPEVLFAGTVKGWVLIIPTWLLTSIHENVMQSNLFNMDTKGAMESVDINGMSVLSSLNLERALFPQGQSKVSIVIRLLYQVGVHSKVSMLMGNWSVCMCNQINGDE